MYKMPNLKYFYMSSAEKWMLSTLGKKINIQQFEIFFLFFSEKKNIFEKKKKCHECVTWGSSPESIKVKSQLYHGSCACKMR